MHFLIGPGSRARQWLSGPVAATLPSRSRRGIDIDTSFVPQRSARNRRSRLGGEKGAGNLPKNLLPAASAAVNINSVDYVTNRNSL
jgi:hypothetical protein